MRQETAVTTTQARLLRHNWRALADLQREMLAQEHTPLAGYKLVGLWQRGRVAVLYGRTDELWVRTIISLELTCTVGGPVEVVRGEPTS
jgi:hypothetical protein